MSQRPDWEQYFMDIAHAVSRRANCTRRQVGCVLVDENKHIISTGYNGAVAGESECGAGACPRGQLSDERARASLDRQAGPERCIAVHAEANALLQAGPRARGATAFVTYRPCPSCDTLLKAAGVERIFYLP